jgi:hypothetical protein
MHSLAPARELVDHRNGITEVVGRIGIAHHDGTPARVKQSAAP